MDVADSATEEKKEASMTEVTLDFAISSVNHIAFIVSDVGNSAYFYSDVLGLQQVKRPNFDRHGAWFTGGNLEIHLILGNPCAPDASVKGSEANVTCFKVADFNATKDKLAAIDSEHGIHLEFEEGEEDSVAYVRDPDGYVFKIGEL